MKIGIDFSPVKADKAGVGNYTCNLVSALEKINSEEFVLYKNPIWFQRALWLQSWVPARALIDRLDVFHATNLVAPLLVSCPIVTTIHDLSSLLYPETHTVLHRLHMSLVPASAKKAKKVIVPSHAIKTEVVKYLNVPAEKVVVVYEGVGEEFKIIEDKERLNSFARKHHLPQRFILNVATLEPRKNIVRLIEAYKLVRDKIPGLKLVLVGKKGWFYQEIFKRVEELGLSQDVIFTDYIPHQELPLIYNLAEIFVYPSLYEGFGLPVLEAMACGVPVVTSNFSSLPEVAGEAALLVDPKDTSIIARSILDILESESLRDFLVQKGLERVKQFTWQKCAEETLKVYRSVI